MRHVCAALGAAFASQTDFGAVADEIVGRIVDELDYAREARDAAAFAGLYADGEDVAAPDVFPDYCSDRVLTLGRLPARYRSSRSGLEIRQKFRRDGQEHARSRK